MTEEQESDEVRIIEGRPVDIVIIEELSPASSLAEVGGRLIANNWGEL